MQEERDVNHLVYSAYARKLGLPEAQRLIRIAMREFLELQTGTNGDRIEAHFAVYAPAMNLPKPGKLRFSG
jgi:hypothetical protein